MTARLVGPLYSKRDAPTVAQPVDVPNTFKLPGETEVAWVDRITGAQPVPVPADSLMTHLQMQCSAWGTYWRASDAHGVELTRAQATELLAYALGVEVEIKP